MVTAMLITSGWIVACTTVLLLRRSEALRRVALVTCGTSQIVLGMAAAAGLTLSAWSDSARAFAAEPASAGGEEIFFETTLPVSVEPGKTVIIPPGRPSWISEWKEVDHKPAINWAAAVAGPCETRQECEKELSNQVKLVADEYINNYLGSAIAARLLNYDGADLKSRLVSPQDVYAETIQVSFGPMEQVHARVEFREDFRRELDQRWREIKAKLRLGQVGLIGAVVLGLLSTAFGFFKANTATRGQRATTLQFAAAATILVIVVAGVSAARYLYWI